MLIVLAVAHQGEEFVLILPAILLVGALFVLRWANAPQQPESDDEADHLDESEVVASSSADFKDPAGVP